MYVIDLDTSRFLLHSCYFMYVVLHCNSVIIASIFIRIMFAEEILAMI